MDLFALVANVRYKAATQQVVTPCAPLFRTAVLRQADLGSSLQGEPQRGDGREENLKTQPGQKATSLLSDFTHQTGLAARLVAADVHPQRLLPQCTLGNLHSKHFIDFSDVTRHIAASSEEAAGGLHTGQCSHTYITADTRTHTRVDTVSLFAARIQSVSEPTVTYIFWSASRQRALQWNSCTMQTLKRCSLFSYRKVSCT